MAPLFSVEDAIRTVQKTATGLHRLGKHAEADALLATVRCIIAHAAEIERATIIAAVTCYMQHEL